jgi:hypothetical protein
MFSRILAAGLIFISLAITGALARAEPGAPRPLPCGMSSTPAGEWKLVSVGGGGLIAGRGGLRLASDASFPLWIDSFGGTEGAVCTELHAVSRQNVYEVAMVRYQARPGLKAPRRGGCGGAVDPSSVNAHFTFYLRPGDWAAVAYPAPEGDVGRAVVYVPRPGQYSADEAIAACVKVTNAMNASPEDVSGTLE